MENDERDVVAGRRKQNLVSVTASPRFLFCFDEGQRGHSTGVGHALFSRHCLERADLSEERTPFSFFFSPFLLPQQR
jgi:hypothetical protein